MIKRDILTTDLVYIWSQESDEIYTDIHCHAEYEIYYFIRGDVDRQIEGVRYAMTPESLLLIPPNSIHGVITKSTRLHQRLSIHFKPHLLDESEQFLLPEIFHASHLYYPNLSTHRMRFLVQSILDCKEMEESLQKMALKHRTISLLTHIYQIHVQNMTMTGIENEKIQSILSYLNSNLHKPITLDQLVRKFYISKN
ncbi:MAG: AraC family ligand binding domain-containing protein, partial [Treponema sp.]|nr:AraC family ligand binding domain-containing protein [Treponema sp.]